ncbi:MAG: hypothetical protein NTW86_15740 [Candidatus Sumerlaeota bacterium]|nr:hypothetical protein [Candidatus Sumerlaeota bacterium]
MTRRIHRLRCAAAAFVCGAALVATAESQLDAGAGAPTILPAQPAEFGSQAPAGGGARVSAGPGQLVDSGPEGPEVAGPRSEAILPKEAEGALRVDKPQDLGLNGGDYDRIVTLDFRDQTIEDVIRLIAAKGKLNILFNPSDLGTQRITMHLESVRLGSALENILRTNKLGWIQEADGILRIVPGAQIGKREIELKTDVVVLNWVKAKDLKDHLRPFLSKDGAIEANEENNSLIVTDTPPSLETVRGLIKKLDEPEKQVLIELHLVDVLQDFAKAHGVNWNTFQTAEEAITQTLNIPAGVIPDPAHPGQFIPDPLNPAHTVTEIIGKKLIPKLNPISEPTGVLTGLATPAVDTAGVATPILGAAGSLALGEAYSLFGRDYWLDLDIQANASRAHAQVLANPRVITLNNLEAKIRVQEKIPFVQGTTANTTGLQTTTIEFKDSGEEITVTPTITANGFIRMEIGVKQQIFRGRVGDGPLDPPQIDERETTTNVIVGDGTTIALGGLEGHRTIDGATGVPWLMDTPVFRWFFQKKSASVNKSTLYLFVRPRIVAVEAAELTEQEKFWFDGVQRTWNVPDEYFDDWHGVWDSGVTP